MRGLVAIALCAALLLHATGCSHPAPHVAVPGALTEHRTLLPNGWSLSPAGTSLPLDELPLNLDVTPDGRRAIVTNNGTGKQSIAILDTRSWTVEQTLPIRAAWLGLRIFDEGRRFAVSGGNDNRIFLYDLNASGAALRDSIVLGVPWPDRRIWVGGIDVDPNGRRIFACGKESDSLYVADLATRQQVAATALPGKPYTCLASRHHPLLFVSLWGKGAIAILDCETLALRSTVSVGAHPNDMVESRDGKRLFVADANLNTVSVVGLEQQRVIETISTALDPNDPPGSTPNSVALSPNGSRLYVANADNNCVAVIDVSESGSSRPLGFIPVGWYPTCVRTLDSGEILVTNGKGEASMPDPEGPNPLKKGPAKQYIGTLLRGTISKIGAPSEPELRAFTQATYRNRPVRETASIPADNPIPRRVGDPSPIKHVFYIIKENRTYDQVFGDLPQGNGDSTLCIFPRKVSPNHHALAEEFVLLDNVYADAEVSADGHNWSMGAYATDYVEKTWPTLYGDRGGDFDYQGGQPTAYPSNGYIWDACLRRGVSFRSYGEFGSNGDDGISTPDHESLRGHMAPHYRCWDLSTSDTTRVRAWRAEFDRFEREGNLPALSIFSLPNDHTSGSAKGQPTPIAYMGQNDLALAQIVDRISHSRYWPESAIFVIEDDAQAGPDHVDAHRTVAMVISPYTKRHFVDHSMYSTSSLLRTIELILGLPPLSQFDLLAQPMYASFTSKPSLEPYSLLPPGVDILETNLAGAYGQERSGKMNFAREDRAPDLELNDIVWHSVRSDAMPAPVRSAFVLAAAHEDEDDD